MSGRRNQESIEWIGEGRARDLARIDGNDRRHLRDAHSCGGQRIANPLLERTREANATQRVERGQLEERDGRNTDGVLRLGAKESLSRPPPNSACVPVHAPEPDMRVE